MDTKEMSPLNSFIDDFNENLRELRLLLKLPEKYERQANQARKKLDEFFLPILITHVKQDLKNPPKGVTKEEVKQTLNNLIEDYKRIAPDNVSEAGKLTFKVDGEFTKRFPRKELEKRHKVYEHSTSYKAHIEKAVLINLVSYLEQSFADVSRVILKEHPEILCLNEKTLTYDEIRSFSELEDAQDYLISLEIEKLLFKPLSAFFEFFEKNVFKTELVNLSKCRNEIIEIKERRNLLIHSGGIVTAKYIKSVDESLLEKYKIEKGKKIGIGKTYLQESINKFELIGLEILFLAALKLQAKDDREAAGWKIVQTIYETFAEKENNLALGEGLSLLVLSGDCKKRLNEEQRDYCQLNYWHILKKQKKFEVVQKESSKFDTTAKNHLISLCFFSVIEDYDKAYEHIIPSLSEEDFNITRYETFPILEGLRKQKKAEEIIKKFKKQKK